MCVHQFVPPIPLWGKSYRVGAKKAEGRGWTSWAVWRVSCYLLLLLNIPVALKAQHLCFPICKTTASISTAFSNCPKDPGVPASLAGRPVTPAETAGYSRAGRDSRGARRKTE